MYQKKKKKKKRKEIEIALIKFFISCSILVDTYFDLSLIISNHLTFYLLIQKNRLRMADFSLVVAWKLRCLGSRVAGIFLVDRKLRSFFLVTWNWEVFQVKCGWHCTSLNENWDVSDNVSDIFTCYKNWVFSQITCVWHFTCGTKIEMSQITYTYDLTF